MATPIDHLVTYTKGLGLGGLGGCNKELQHTLNITILLKFIKILVIDEGIFEGWLKEEKEYMQSLHKEPEEKILQMECWQNLIQLQASEDDLITESKVWMPIGF
ncbi:hypothetical protein SERLADRAFT_404775 [Serpula lacrymans var. lacrymans S7.9]|uniref:Uncharacterized protein n=1 Tax=Serpula lacrymans var. lacrymans (strain S7.9) TaxID=578457 RepID=F8NCZ2_SERL9|nr:uncharacterized protein SERLADRAFT_404775 [Serpula lacrymans var. lacrymans S7.9]EGO30736.1 hypothetical protein SERLADRAFT_404775 [Serpula lacrymans var. lacrymans S7.9]